MALPGSWVHGVNTIVEYPERLKRIQHAGWGTLIEQDEDPPNRKNNWFHLPIPSPSIFSEEGNKAKFGYAFLRASVNENARIATIHLSDDNQLIHAYSPGWVDREIDEVISFPGYPAYDYEMKGSFAISIRVEFLSGTPRGRVIFRSAGATIGNW